MRTVTVVEDDAIDVAHVARRGPGHFSDGVVEDDGIETVGFHLRAAAMSEAQTYPSKFKQFYRLELKSDV